MSVEILAALDFNAINITCLGSLRWSRSTIDELQPALIICIVAAIHYGLLWLLVLFCSSLHQRSIQWLYAYLATDILLLSRFFFSYIVHVHLAEYSTNHVWITFICYIDATADNYLNVLEVYMLLALNIGRYYQIVRGVNVYIASIRSLVIAHLLIYILPIFVLAIELWAGSARLVKINCDYYDIMYTNIYVKLANTFLGYTAPICFNVFIICLNMRHLHLIARQRGVQVHLSARDKYHRSLVIQFLVFYTVWLLLWSPDVLSSQFATEESRVRSIAALLNYIEISLDPIIIAASDVRFQKVWLSYWKYLKHRLLGRRGNLTRVAPITTGCHEGCTGQLQKVTRF
jgi:hypothetical protein